MAHWQRRQPTQMRIAPTIAVDDQAGVELHRHRRCESDLTSRDDDGGYLRSPPGSAARASTAKHRGEAESQESLT